MIPSPPRAALFASPGRYPFLGYFRAQLPLLSMTSGAPTLAIRVAGRVAAQGSVVEAWAAAEALRDALAALPATAVNPQLAALSSALALHPCLSVLVVVPGVREPESGEVGVGLTGWGLDGVWLEAEEGVVRVLPPEHPAHAEAQDPSAPLPPLFVSLARGRAGEPEGRWLGLPKGAPLPPTLAMTHGGKALERFFGIGS